MATTIEDVARKAGVSTATVSRALRGLPNVAPSTRRHVLEVAQALDYAMNARTFPLNSGGRIKTVGIVMPLADQWFYNEVATSAEALLFNQGYDVLRVSLATLKAQNEIIQRLIAERDIDGLILVSLVLLDKSLAYLQHANCPVVTIETLTDNFPAIYTDNLVAARMATQHLINLGHEQIGVISGLPDDPLAFQLPAKRLHGYQQALESHGIEPRPELNLPGNFSYAGGAEAMSRLLAVPEPPTAVFAFSDTMAIGALKTIRDMGLNVPEDISVIGFDDQEVAEYVSLTTIHQPVAKYGERAVALLLEQFEEKPDYDETTAHEHLPTKLIIRGTTGPRRKTSLTHSRK